VLVGRDITIPVALRFLFLNILSTIDDIIEYLEYLLSRISKFVETNFIHIFGDDFY
jgi:hypothetical protein